MEHNLTDFIRTTPPPEPPDMQAVELDLARIITLAYAVALVPDPLEYHEEREAASTLAFFRGDLNCLVRRLDFDDLVDNDVPVSLSRAERALALTALEQHLPSAIGRDIADRIRKADA